MGVPASKHTLCKAGEGSDDLMCNNFGHFDKFSKRCACQKGYAGDFCEVCANPAHEYPDCSGEYESDLMESSAFNAYNQRRTEQVYHKDYHRSQAATNPFQQQCSYTDFPNYLNQL